MVESLIDSVALKGYLQRGGDGSAVPGHPWPSLHLGILPFNLTRYAGSHANRFRK